MKSDSFETTLNTLTLNELQELAKTLSIKLTRAQHSSVTNVELTKELERELLIVKNRISALRIRC